MTLTRRVYSPSRRAKRVSNRRSEACSGHGRAWTGPARVGDRVAGAGAARGVPVGEDAVEDPPEPELLGESRGAGGITRLAESGEAVDPGDVGSGVAGSRNLYDQLLGAHPA